MHCAARCLTAERSVEEARGSGVDLPLRTSTLDSAGETRPLARSGGGQWRSPHGCRLPQKTLTQAPAERVRVRQAKTAKRGWTPAHTACCCARRPKKGCSWSWAAVSSTWRGPWLALARAHVLVRWRGGMQYLRTHAFLAPNPLFEDGGYRTAASKSGYPGNRPGIRPTVP